MTKQLAPFALAYALVAALVLPGSLVAAEEEPVPPPAAPVEPSPEPPPAQQPTAPPQQQTAPAQQPAPQAQPAPATTRQADATDGEEETEAPVARAAAPGSVTIKDFSFSPATITVNVGETVSWTNAGPSEHSATGDGFDTGVMPEGGSGSHRFTEAGTFSYICTPHPNMKGTVRVLAASSGGGQGSDPGGSGAAPAAGSATAGEGSGSSAGRADELPASGADAGVLAGLGLALLALGFVVRRRSAESS